MSTLPCGLATAGRPRLLVSVSDADEAADALFGGADWIDLKQPRDGPLGAVNLAAACEAAATVGGRAPLSAAAGELSDWPNSESRKLLSIPAISLIKLGLAGLDDVPWQSQWRQAQAEIAAAGKQLVAVAYVDFAIGHAPPPAAILSLAADAGAPWILLDTFDKSGGALLDHMAPLHLVAFLARARAASCGTAVAGRLDHATIRKLPGDLVDVVAVRGAACDGPRTARISRARVAELLQLLASRGSTADAAMPMSSPGIRRQQFQ